MNSLKQFSAASAGKITLFTLAMGVFLFSAYFFMEAQYRSAEADDEDVATTAVQVLNSPPVWITGPSEDPASTPSEPTNEGNEISWTAEAQDPNHHDGETNDYWLLICKEEADFEEDHDDMIYDGENDPQCPGEDNQWAISGLTDDGAEATATYETQDERQEEEVNEWHAYLCDNDPEHPRCNFEDVRQEPKDDEGDPLEDDHGASPFFVNYRPVFAEFEAPEGTDPGETATWTSTASSTNTFTGEGTYYEDEDEDMTIAATDHQVQLHVCRAQKFDEESSECAAGDLEDLPHIGGSEDLDAWYYASSTLETADPSVSYTLPIPKPTNDSGYEARGYLIDNFGFTAMDERLFNWDEAQRQADDRPLPVNNVAPEVETDSVNILDQEGGSGDLILAVAQGETEDFGLEVTTVDDNSCMTLDDEDEMTAIEVNMYRSGEDVDCQDGSDYDGTNCYPYDVDEDTYNWQMECQPAGSGTEEGWECGDYQSRTMEWECSFPLWYAADPTDTGSPWDDEEWRAAVNVIDIEDAKSGFTEGDEGRDLISFLAFDLGEDTIAYNDLEPGMEQDLEVATPIRATGNTGVDQDLIGTPMCPEFELGEDDFGCDSYSYEDEDDMPYEDGTIPSVWQQFAVGTETSYDEGIKLPDEADDETWQEAQFLDLNVPKTTVIEAPSSESIGWGIKIPEGIVDTGAYTGQNTFTGQVSEAENW